MTRTIHKGPCRVCRRPMVDQREWRRNPGIRQGRVKAAGYGRCNTCYTRERRHGTLHSVMITARYPVECNRCGPIGEATRRDEANRIRAEHLEKHEATPIGSKLSDTELARLRRDVGLAS